MTAVTSVFLPTTRKTEDIEAGKEVELVKNAKSVAMPPIFIHSFVQ